MSDSRAPYLRYHLGLVVPAHHPPSIRVKDQFYTWTEGESVLFDDSWSIRAVLIVDVMRPFIAPVFRFNLLMRKLGERFYGPRIVAKARRYQFAPPGRRAGALPYFGGTGALRCGCNGRPPV